MKLLKKKLLFALYCSRQDRIFSYQPYLYLYYRASEYDRGSVRDAVNQLITDGFIDKLTRNRRAWLRLTTAGREILVKQMPLLAHQGPWDRRWRLVIITGRIGAFLRPFRRQLYLLNYRRLARGIYLSPSAVTDQTRDCLIRHRWLNQVAVVESRRILGADDQQLARNVWRLEEIGTEYGNFITLAKRLLSSGRRNLLLLQQAKFGFKAVFDAYFKLLCHDPALPKALLPPDWPGEEAGDLFFRLAELAKTAKI